MPVVFVIAEEWMLRAGVRAELRERGIKALGMESAGDVAPALAEGAVPSAIVLDGNASAARDARIQRLVHRTPAVLIASKASPELPALLRESASIVLSRPLQVGEIVAAVMQILVGPNA